MGHAVRRGPRLVRFAILGPIEVSDQAGVTLALGKRMERALLAMLLVHPDRIVSTDALIDALWPHGAPARPEASLHSAVARLRRSLEPDRAAGQPPRRLVHTPPGYRLVLEDDELDARRFETLLAAGHRASAAGDASRAQAALRDALAEWRGLALAEFAFEPFAESEAARLEQLRLGAIEDRLAADLALDTPGLVPELEQHVAAHPLREHLWEHLLVALYRDGRAPDALRRAQELRVQLGELGLEPSPRLAELEGAILRHDTAVLDPQGAYRGAGVSLPADTLAPPHASDGAAAPPPVHRAHTPCVPEPTRPRWWQPGQHFVGREAALERLDEAWRSARDGDVVVVALSGEPGIGKTWLAMEAAERMAQAGAVVLAGRCSPEPVLPYEPFVEALERLVDALDDEALAELGAHGTRLVRLLPQLAPRLERLGPTEPTGPAQGASATSETEHYLLFVAVAALLARVTAAAPLVILIDDVQWADPSTLLLADHLLRADDTAHLLLLLTLRDTDVAPDSELRQRLDLLTRAHLLGTVSLGGFTTSEVEAVLAHEQPDQSADLAAKLHDATGGNPFFVRELLRALNPSAATTDTLQAPTTVQALVRSRLDLLDPPAREVLSAAALVGRRVDVDLLMRALGEPHAAVVEAIDAAVRIGLLVTDAEVTAFRHDLVRAELTTGRGPAWVAAHHRAIADALVQRRGGLDQLDTIAHHYGLAAHDGDATKAVHYALLAGRRAAEQHAHATAATRYEGGLEALTRTPHASPVDELLLLLEACEAWRKAGELDRCREFGRRALPLARVVGNAAQLRAAALAAAQRNNPLDQVENTELAGELARTAAHLAADPAATSDDEAYLALALGNLAIDRRDAREAVAQMQRALQLMEQAEEPATIVIVIDHALTALGEMLDLPARLALSTRQLAAAAASGEAEHELLAHSNARWLHLTAGDTETAARYAARYEELADALGMPRYLAGVAQRRAMEAIVAGRFAEGEAYAAETVLHRPDAEFFEGSLAQVAFIRVLQGRSEEVRELLAAQADGPSLAWRVAAAMVAVESGDEELARGQLHDTLRTLPNLPRDVNWLFGLALAARVSFELRDVAAARILWELLHPAAGRITLGGTGALSLGPVALALAELSAVFEDVRGAEDWLAKAEDFLRHRDADGLHARIALIRGEALAQAGSDRRAEAVAQLSAGLALASHIGLEGALVGRARELLSQLR